MKTKYVVGVPYIGELLILQRSPNRTGKLAFMNGLLNGIGGHIDANESPGQAMSRECLEETGQLIERSRWERVYGEEYDTSLVYFYICQITQEEAGQMLARSLEQKLYAIAQDELDFGIVPNLNIIAAMIRIRQQGFATPLNVF